MLKKNSLKMAALAAGLLIPGVAAAATSAIVTTDLNFRTGPDSSYPAFDVIPEGDDVTVYGCLDGYGWCDIEWAGYRGWVSGDYLAYLGQRYYRRPISSIGISIGLPVIGYDRYDYYDRWYDDDYFDRWVRREVRQERRQDRQEVREERREDRRELRRDRREDRQDTRRERRQFEQAERERQEELAAREQEQQEQAARQQRREERAARQQQEEERANRRTREERRAARQETRQERPAARQVRPEGNAAELEEWRREQYRNR